MLFSVQTPAAGGTAFAQFAAAWCYDGNGYILNDTGTSLDVRIGASGSIQTLAAGGTLPIKLVYSMAELYVRRTDQGTTQVTVEAQVGTGSAGGGGSTADMGVIASAAAADAVAGLQADSDLRGVQASDAGIFSAARTLIESGIGSQIAVIGDSVNIEYVVSPWPMELGKHVGAKHSCNFGYQAWSDTAQSLLPRVDVAVAAGGRRVIRTLDGASAGSMAANGRSTATGNISVRAEIKPDVWPPAADSAVAAQWGSQAAFMLQLMANGKLRFFWNDGSGNDFNDSTTATTVRADYGWVRCDFVGNNGAGACELRFYESANGTDWDSLGVYTGGTTSTIRTGSADPYEVGARGGSSEPFLGRIRRVVILDNPDGHYLLPDSVDVFTPSNAYPTFEGAPDFLVMNVSKGGTDFDYWTAVRVAAGIPYAGTPIVAVSLGHNEYGSTGSAYTAKLDTMKTSIAAACPNASFVAIAQNPRTDAPQTQYCATRRAELKAWAKRNTGVFFWDCCAQFARIVGGYTSMYLVDDAVHPNSAGHAYWGVTAGKAWDAS